MNSCQCYAFEIMLHPLGVEPDSVSQPSVLYTDAWGSWPTLTVSRQRLSEPMAIGFDEANARLSRLKRMFFEPDGSFVWTGQHNELAWQVDGNAYEFKGRVFWVALKGSCPITEFDQLLAGFGWPEETPMMQLLRPAVFLDEVTFRRHAARRAATGDGEILRPR